MAAYAAVMRSRVIRATDSAVSRLPPPAASIEANAQWYANSRAGGAAQSAST